MRMSSQQYQQWVNNSKSTDRQRTGYINREMGADFEAFIDASCEHYKRHRVAYIKKAPEAMKIIKPEIMDGKRTGRFLACHKASSQADYKGTVYGGHSVAFEAKHTVGTTMEQSRVSPEQAEDLDAELAMGSVCFVIIGFSMKDFYRIPWRVWKDMKHIYGRKHLKPEDLGAYRLPLDLNGILLFLNGLEVSNIHESHH